ncbi:GNAT family N-acetyltransferase [Solibacillus sp. FSL W7-1324]|uniref:GNAT family N-acetyltransferase n=1 Tax=Solibacillus sp. FSL W7-1324 TaxID=2921701 RepID=UPI0030FC024F
MNKIRKATVEVAVILTDIAINAKGSWGYSEDFMNAWKDTLTITGDDIQSKVIYVLEEEKTIKGFYCLCTETKKLENFFVVPIYIGQGLGKILWKDIILKAKEYGLSSFQFNSDPNAYEFYLKMGAKRIIYVESAVIPGRIYPLMEYVLT